MSVLEALQDENLLGGVEEAEKTAEEKQEVIIPEVPAPVGEPAVEVPEEKIVEAPEGIIEEIKVPEVITEENTTNKIKVDYLDFVKQHKAAIDAYETEKSADYSQLSPEEILSKALSIKYPSLSKEDIQEEMRERYGVGADDLDSDEIKAKQRKLKIDSTDSIKELEAYRDGLQLPEFEIEAQMAAAQEPVDLDKVVAELSEKQLQSEKEWRETTWTPEIKKSTTSLDKISHKVDLGEGIGEISVEIDLTEEDKTKVANYLADWIYHPEDQKFVDKDGNPDMTSFVKERSSIVLLDKIVEQVAKATAAKVRETHFKTEVINFNQDPKQADISKHGDTSEFSLSDKLRN